MDTKIHNLTRKANDIRKIILTMLATSKSGHPGGSLSMTDLLTVLYFEWLNIDAKNPIDIDRDIFILAKGHGAPALYAVLAEKNFFDKKHLNFLRQAHGILQGHPVKGSVPGIEMSTGSLGQGLSIAIGAALSQRLNKAPGKVVVLMGDGEMQEGQVWEGAMAAAHFKLGNLIGIVDRNEFQIDGCTNDVMNLGDLAQKWEAFGWKVSVIDGHNIRDILTTLMDCRAEQTGPVMIIAKTVKGKGVSFMERKNKYHGVAPSQDELLLALDELK